MADVNEWSIVENGPQHPAPLPGFEYPAPRHPWYLHQERTEDIEELLPIARSHVARRYGRMALRDPDRTTIQATYGDTRADVEGVEPPDKILIVTAAHQDPVVFEAIERALLETGVESVESISTAQLGLPDVEYSAADGWREITDRLAPMVEEGVEFNVVASALKRYLDDRPGYTSVFAGLAGRPYWRHHTSTKLKNNWLFATYEDFIHRSNAFPDELWRSIDLKVVASLGNASEVHVTSMEGTDISWEVTPEQAELWVKGAYLSGHIRASTIDAIRRGHTVETFVEQADILYPTLNGVVGGTSNHTGYFPHIEVEVENGMIKEIRGGGRYGELWREVLERYRDVEYPGYPYKGWHYFNDCSIGTNPKSARQISTLWSYNDSWTNLPERAQAGVIHFGFGAEHWDQKFLRYAKENHLPTMHFPHVHNIFATYEIRQRDTGEWKKIIEKGRLTVLDEPDVVRHAVTLGDASLLEYDWIPAVPGINYPGDYRKDYYDDPVAWIKRDQTGEFAPQR